jgi:hypothetical protein
MGALDREDVAVIDDAAIGRCEEVGGSGCGKSREEEKR